MSGNTGERSGLAALAVRLGRHRQALLVLALAILAVLVFVPGLGRPGLWDPWEMDRAHVARAMAGPTRVLVVEPAAAEVSADPGAAAAAEAAEAAEGKIAAWIRTQRPDGVRVLVPEDDAPRAARQARSELRAARALLEKQPVELLVVDLSDSVRKLSDGALLGQTGQTLEEALAIQPALRIAVNVAGVEPPTTGGAVTPETVRDAMTRANVRNAVRALQSRYGLLRELPDAAVEQIEESLREDPAFVPPFDFFSGTDDPTLAAVLDDVEGAQRTRAQFRAAGETWYLPVFDYWLMSVSYRWFGFTEGSTRLPFLLWGLLGLLVVVVVTHRLFGFRAAILAGVVLATTPHFVGQARIASGDISFAVTLAAGVGAFLVVAREGLKPVWLAAFFAAAVLGFLSNGLTSLLLLWLVTVGWALAMGERRKQALLPIAGLTLLFAAGVAAVFLPQDWTFWSHFKFMDRPFEGGPNRDIRGVDYFVRQIGFGCFPWSALLPFALGRLWWKAREQDAAAPGAGSAEAASRAASTHGVILWFGLSFAVLTLLLKDFSHVVFPAAPALAIACGVLLDDLLDGDRARGFLAFGMFLLLLMLAKQLGENSEPLTQFLTYDPHFAESGGNSFPESVLLSRAVKYLVVFSGLLWLVWGLRLGTLARRGAQLFRQPKPFWIALVGLTVALVVALIGALLWKFDVTLSRPEARSLQPADRMAAQAVMGSAWAVAGYVVLFLAFWVHLVTWSAWGRRVQARWRPFRVFGRLAERLPLRWFALVGVGAFVALAGLLFALLSGHWSTLAAQVFPDTPDTYVSDLLLRNRSLLVLVGLAVVLVVNRLLVAPWRRFAVVFRALELFERPRFAVGTFVFAATVVVLSATHALYAELALHVSQKHIVETYLGAEGREEIGDNIFKHGSFARAGGGDANFYTNLIPEIVDRNDVIRALQHREDTVVRAADHVGTRTVLIRGFDPANDANGDGKRDYAAAAGIATKVGEGFLEDETADWAPDAWKGWRVYLDGDQSFAVTGNTATRLALDGTPRRGARTAERRYAIDQPDARDHAATAGAASDRAYFLLPKLDFSEVNHAFRKASDGRPIPTLDAASSRIVLAVSQLREGEADQNWISQALTTEEELKTRDWFPDSDDDVFHPVYANWDDQIEIIGYVLEHEKVSRRQDYRVKMFFRTKKEMKTSYKIFMHVDRSGTANRIHSDHWPLNLEKSPGDDPEKSCRGCFQTRHWMVGDIYVDTFSKEVPLGTPSGPQELWLGFYNPNDQKRLSIKDFDKETVEHDGQNRVKIGSFDVM